MRMKKIKKYILAALLVMFSVAVWYGTKQAAAAVRILEEITAYYNGAAVEVGEKIDINDVSVMAEYMIHDTYMSYEDYEEVKKGFTLTPSVITREGENRVIVTYNGKSTEIFVDGKSVEYITAYYLGDEVYVGTKIIKEKIEVYAYFSDGSFEQVKDFTLPTTTVPKEGINIIPVTYGGKTEYVYIYGKAPLAVEEIYAYYDGDSIIEGNTINKADIVVEVLYNDYTSKMVTNFNISPAIVKTEGENEITVTYGDKSTTITIWADAREVVGEPVVKYIGPGVIVGDSVEKDDIEVTLTYNDGSTDTTDDFYLFGEEILFEGENVIIVYGDDFMAEVVVYGVQGFTGNFDNSISRLFFNADYTSFTEVTLGMNMWLEQDKFSLEAADAQKVEQAVQKVVSTDDYIGFKLAYDDDEMVLEFPMAMKVTVPEDYDPEKVGVYYMSGKSNIMAKLDGKFVDEEQTEYQFVVYEPGTYVVVEVVPDSLVTEIVVEEELTLKVNRSYSLNPVVLPLSAVNRKLTYWSTDEDVATVSENGKIRTYQEGSCEIWIEAQDDSGAYVVVQLEVRGGR